MNLISVTSSNIVAIGYENGTLEVHFHNNSAYHYFNVPENIFRAFLNAPSKGKFLHRNIKDKYSYSKIS